MAKKKNGKTLDELDHAELAQKLSWCCKNFQDGIHQAALKAGKNHLEVYRLWLKYARDCQIYDQSPIWGEFTEWYKKDLEPATT